MNIVKLTYFALALFACHCLAAAPARAERSFEISGTPHNLSVTGGGGAHNVKSTVEVRICIFCHTPHHATSITPLWSREPSNVVYTLYASPTLSATLQQPRGASRLCLSCHDGTVALGLLSNTLNVNLDASLPKMPSDVDPKKNANLGTDLSDDHPISFVYPNGPELADPATLKQFGIRLESGLYLECTSCHNPHDNTNGNFLLVNTDLQHDALCVTCHNKRGWNNLDTAHRTGGTRYPTVQAQVAADGCVNCHQPHSAPGRISLLKSSAEENNCMVSCHKGSPYGVNVSDSFQKPYAHFVQNYLGVHSQNEGVPVPASKKHVECVDCHNPHEAGSQGVPMSPPNLLVAPANLAPAVSGALREVQGVDETGTTPLFPAFNEYQVCFKCHSSTYADRFVDSRFPSNSVARPTRLIQTFDESQRFYSNNPSYHPVLVNRPDRGAGVSGRSLRTGLKETLLRIYCVDCHQPHGSDEPHILRARNLDTFPASGTDYPLCYSCHDSSFLMGSSSSATLHQKHVFGTHDNGDTRAAPCAACHDPHGVSTARGAVISRNDHLINFDGRYVGQDSFYDSTTRNCTVTPGPAGSCHTTNPRLYKRFRY